MCVYYLCKSENKGKCLYCDKDSYHIIKNEMNYFTDKISLSLIEIYIDMFIALSMYSLSSKSM